MIDGQPADIITHAERMSPQERIAEVVDADLYNWIGTEYKSQLVAQIEQRRVKMDVHTAKSLAHLQNKLARTVHCLREVHDQNSPENQQKWREALYNRLFGKDHDSVVNAMGHRNSAEIAARVSGALAPLTLIDLVRQSRPELGDRLKASEIVTSPDDDAHGKVDLVLELGDKNMYDQPIVRLVQLKSRIDATGAQIDVIQEDNLSSVRFIEKDEAKKMLAVGAVIKKARPDVEVRAFVVEVPGIESETVGKDPFGRIQDPEIVRRFRRDAVDVGFLPAKTTNGGPK